MRKIISLLVVLVVCSPAVRGQKAGQLSDSQLGRMLREYNVASWHATDAVVALKPANGTVARYIAKKTDSGWVVVFARFNVNKDAFLIVYEATQGSRPEDFTVKTYDPSKQDTAFLYIAVKAIQIALENSPVEKRPYNTYVLPLDSGQFYVYVLPAQTVADVYPLGGDTRFLVSADGSSILETRRLYKTFWRLSTLSRQDRSLRMELTHMC